MHVDDPLRSAVTARAEPKSANFNLQNLTDVLDFIKACFTA